MADDNRTRPLKVAIIGAGFGGLGMAHALKRAGIGHFAILEKSESLGGTWRDNTYPGAACDIPSHLYSYSFERRYPWTRRYAHHDEILAYQHHIARKHDLLRHLRCGAEVMEAVFDAQRALWILSLRDGSRVEAESVISAVGQLHRPAYPNLPGRERFRGESFHSALWNHGYALGGKRVAVIGSGASAVQFVPAIAPEVASLTLFQRSPGWTIPKVEKAFSGFERWLLRKVPLIHDLDRLRIFLLCELLAVGYNGNRLVSALVSAASRLQLWWQVRDPVLRRKLRPDFPIGCKRILLTTDWLRALVRPNVEVVDTAIMQITENGVRTVDGRQYEVDALIYATGFTATEFLTPMRVRGRDGRDLHQSWAQGAEAYLGMAVAGFPNFFVLYGPNTNLGSGSILYMLERQQRYLAQLLTTRERQGWASVEVRAEVQAAYAREMRQRSANTSYSGDCQSWYKTADGRNTNNWVGSMIEFARRTRRPDPDDFQRVERSVAGATHVR